MYTTLPLSDELYGVITPCEPDSNVGLYEALNS